MRTYKSYTSSTQRRRRWPRRLGLVAVALAVAALAAVALTPRGVPEPSRDDMEAIAGVSLGAPAHVSDGPVESLWARVRAWRSYFRQPIPNQMAVLIEGESWIYGFRADSSYAPPAAGPLACTRSASVLECRSETRGGWTYSARFVPSSGEGTFTAAVVPRD